MRKNPRIGNLYIIHQGRHTTTNQQETCVTTPADQLFAVFAEAEGHDRPLLQLDLTFPRLMDDVVVPYHSNETFFIDGAPIAVTKVMVGQPWHAGILRQAQNKFLLPLEIPCFLVIRYSIPLHFTLCAMFTPLNLVCLFNWGVTCLTGALCLPR